MKRAASWGEDRLLGWVPLAVFGISLFTQAMANYLSFKNPSGDLAIFVQSLFYSVDFNAFMHNSFEGGGHLGVHFSPALVLLIPLMRIFPTYLTLLITNGLLLLTATAWLHSHLAKQAPATARILLIMLTCHATLSHDTYKDFHALSMMTLPFVGMFISFEKKHLGGWLCWSLVMVTIRENLFLLVFCWGLITLVHKRDPRWYVPLFLISATHFWVANFLMPQIYAGGIRPGIGDYFSQYGQSPSEILAAVIADPALPLRMVFTLEKARYLLGICLPFLLVLPLFRWCWLLPALPTLGVILLSSNGRLADPKLHFSVEVVLWCAVATLQFLRAHETRLQTPGWQRFLKIMALLLILHFGIACTRNLLEISNGLRSERYQSFKTLSAQIPHEINLVAPRYLANHLAWRKHIYFLEETNHNNTWPKMDLLMLETKDADKAPQSWQIQRQEGSLLLLVPASSRDLEPNPKDL